MKRKVIKQANQAYTITLPIDWVRKNKISSGAELDVVESEKSVIISSTDKVEGEHITLSAQNWSERNLHLYITSLYSRGADVLTIKTSKDISPAIFKILNNTLGFALVSQQKGEYIIKDLGGGSYSQLDEIFKRVFQMVILFYEDAINDIAGKKEATIEDLKVRDSEVNKFCLYLQRSINKQSYSDIIQGRVLFTYSYALEKISDEIERLWRLHIKHQLKNTSQLKEAMTLSKHALENAFDCYFQFAPEKTQEIYPIRELVRQKSVSLKSIDALTLRCLRHIVKIAEDAADLAQLTIMKKFSNA